MKTVKEFAEFYNSEVNLIRRVEKRYARIRDRESVKNLIRFHVERINYYFSKMVKTNIENGVDDSALFAVIESNDFPYYLYKRMYQ